MQKKIKLGLVLLASLSLGLVGCNTGESSVGTSSSSSSSSSASSPSDSSSTNPSTSTTTPVEEPDVYEPIEETLVSADGVTTGRLDKEGKYYTDYATKKEASEAGKEVAVTIAEEGDVLLKNENNTLPLSKYEKKVTLFGMHSVDLVVAGGGSGAGTLDNDGIMHSTLQSSMEDAGFSVNPRTISLYTSYLQMGTINNELPLANYTQSTIESYSTYGDAAIVTLSREGTENKDLATNSVADHANEDDHVLQLDDNEKALIKHVKENFDKVIVLINSSNIMQIPELAAEKTDSNLGVDAILWIGGVGNNGVDAVGKILNGEVNPSGHTSDIWSADFTKDPTWTNFGFDTQNKDANGNRMDASYYDEDGNQTNYSQVEYREGIYLGYKYYETKAHDMGAEGEAWYDENVLYPFGYGLSYTTFDWEWAGVEDNVVIDAANRTVTVRVKVTNTGDVAGKDVVQVYYSAPYTSGEIEKASNNLVNFAKTDMLEPGESQIVEVQFVAQDMASFDWNDANKNGFSGYELEAGDYIITANRDSHTPVLSTTRKIESDIRCETDYTSGKEIKPIFTGEFDSTNETLLENMISRATGLEQPKPASKEDRTLDDATLKEYDDQDIYYHSELKTSDPWYVSSVPSNWNQGVIDSNDPITLAEMSGIDYELPQLKNGTVTIAQDAGTQKWETFMNQLSWEDMANIVSGDAKSGPGISAMANIGKPEDNYADGPVQIRGGTLFPSNPILAASFNTDLAEQKGRIIGNQAIFAGLSQWAGGGMNTHRSPFSGRNFEYFSQDAFHSARFSEAEVTGALSKGLITYCKHFFLNDQESFRADYGGVFTWATEQVIRENYLRPFEFAIKAGSMGLMSSFNRIGKQVTTNSYAIHQYLLRDEWDSKADVCTDAWAKAYVPVNKMALSGSDQLLGQSSSYSNNAFDHGTWDPEKKTVLVAEGENVTSSSNPGTVEDDSLYYGVRIRAQRALYTRANSSTAQNGFTAGEKIVVNLERGVSNNIPVTIAGTNDVTISLAQDATMPQGLKLVNGNVISGNPSTEGSWDINVNVTVDGWITSTAVLELNVVSAVQIDGKAATTAGETKLALNQAYDGKIQAPSLAYGTVTGSRMIVNWYEYKFQKYNRNEDKTASDIITIDAADADVAHEYSYKVTGDTIPGVSFKTVTKWWDGLSHRGGYDVPDYVQMSGTPTQAGTYHITVTINLPTTFLMSGWLMTFGCGETQYVQEITIVVE